jgi:hypothetical protein
MSMAQRGRAAAKGAQSGWPYTPRVISALGAAWPGPSPPAAAYAGAIIDDREVGVLSLPAGAIGGPDVAALAVGLFAGVVVLVAVVVFRFLYFDRSR